MMNDLEIKILDRFKTRTGFLLTVRDNRQYRIGQTVRCEGRRYTITGVSRNSSLNVIGLNVVKAP